MDTWRVVRGTTASYIVQLQDELGNPVTSYTPADLPSAELWPGDAQAVLLLPTAEWVAPELGQIRVRFSSLQSGSLEPGRYQVRTRLLSDGELVELHTAWLDVVPSAGADPVPKSYCTLNDMLNECSDLHKLMVEADQTGFAEQRAMARDWTDDLVVRHSTQPALMAVWPATSLYPSYPDDVQLRELLEQDRLVITGASGRRLVRANALYACYLVYKRQITGNVAGSQGSIENPFIGMAERFLRESRALVQARLRVDDSTAMDGSSYRYVDLTRATSSWD